MKFSLCIADIHLEVHSPFDIILSEESIPFLNDVGDTDVLLEYAYADGLTEIKEDPVYAEANHMYAENTVYLRPSPEKMPYAAVYEISKTPLHMVCRLQRGMNSYVNYAKNIYTVFSLETVLLHFRALILHASFIGWNDMGVLFSAPSGVGKSTQAELWEQYEDAEILNGDRAGIRKRNDIWYAYGLPIAGSSGIYRNEKKPLRCIVLLEQAKENKIRRVSSSEAYRFLYSEVMIHRWDSQFENQASLVLIELLQDIPVYMLQCRPDQGSVETLKQVLEEVY